MIAYIEKSMDGVRIFSHGIPTVSLVIVLTADKSFTQ